MLTAEKYQQQLAEKIELFKQDFSAFEFPEIQIFESPIQHFRMRAEFRIWHKGPATSYCMFSDDAHKRPYDIMDFPIGSALMNRLMPMLIDDINANEILKYKLYQMDFLTTRSGQALVTFIYHKNLDEAWLEAAKQVEKRCGIHIIGRSKNNKLIVSQDYVIEEFSIAGKTYKYQQIESGFTQPNGFVCESMLNWAVNHSKNIGRDLLELYCGNGNFTLPLSQNFNKVLATEISKPSTQSAIFNMEMNAIKNIQLARLSSEELSEAMNKVRNFNRLAHVDLASYNFSTLFVDPPRSGLDDKTLKFSENFDNIIYISCNPKTLKENLQTLCHTHKITHAALFDQFPYTHHLEAGVILTRR